MQVLRRLGGLDPCKKELPVLPEIGASGSKRRQERGGDEEVSGNGGLHPGWCEKDAEKGRSHRFFGRGEPGQEVDDGGDLGHRFPFPEGIGRKDIALRAGNETKSGDEKLPGQNDDDGPGWKERVGSGSEHDQSGTGQDFVDERIHQFAEIGDETPASGDESVEPVGQGGQDEEDQGDLGPPGEGGGEDGDEDEGHEQPGEGELVWQVHG